MGKGTPYSPYVGGGTGMNGVDISRTLTYFVTSFKTVRISRCGFDKTSGPRTETLSNMIQGDLLITLTTDTRSACLVHFGRQSRNEPREESS